MLSYDITLHGGITGNLWWPVGEPAGKSVRIDLTREEARFTEAPTLRELLLSVLCEEGGDFGGDVRFTGDSTLTVTSRSNGRTHSRDWPVTAFPSISDMVAEDTFTGDFMHSDDDC